MILPSTQENDPRLNKIYHLGEQKFWYPASAIDWSLPYNTQTPRYFRWALRGFEPFMDLSQGTRDEICARLYKWVLDQGVHGEMFGMLAAGILARSCETENERLLACELAWEEARHYEAIKTLALKFGPIGPPHPRVLEIVAWAEAQGVLGVFMGLQAGERAGVPSYKLLARFGGPLFQAVYGRIADDESRHLGFGVIGIERYMQNVSLEDATEMAQKAVDGYSYWAYPSPVFDAYDLPGIATYWKPFYENSRLRQEMVEAFHRLGLPVTQSAPNFAA
jgi:hypothetical protein